jgi:hypothetical protein
MGTQEHPHQGEPSGQRPTQGQGGPSSPEVEGAEEKLRAAEQHAEESGTAAQERAGEGGESGAMGGSN